MKEFILPMIKGACIAIFLSMIGLEIDNYRWWVAMVALNIMAQI